MEARRGPQAKGLPDGIDHLPIDDHNGSSSGAAGGAGTKRRAQISVACDSCRAKKIKCSGDRPTCAFCEDRKIECTYDRDPDVTRLASLRRRHVALEHEAEQMRRLIDVLYGATHQDSLEVLRRLRSQATLDDVLHSLYEGHLLSAAGPNEQSNISPTILAEASSAVQMSSQLASHRSPGDTESGSSQRSPAITPGNPMRIENLLLGRHAASPTTRPSTSQSLTSTATDQRSEAEVDARSRHPR